MGSSQSSPIPLARQSRFLGGLRGGFCWASCSLAGANCPACKPVFPRVFGGVWSVSKKSNKIKAQG